MKVISAFVKFLLCEVKAKFSLCLIKHHIRKIYGGIEVNVHAFITLVPDGGWWSASRHGRLNSLENTPVNID